MSDRLRDLLADTTDWHDWHEDSMEVVFAAAGRWLALTETGQRVDYCETHRTLVVSEVRVCPLAHHETPQRPCTIVPKFLADYLTEEE